MGDKADSWSRASDNTNFAAPSGAQLDMSMSSPSPQMREDPPPFHSQYSNIPRPQPNGGVQVPLQYQGQNPMHQQYHHQQQASNYNPMNMGHMAHALPTQQYSRSSFNVFQSPQGLAYGQQPQVQPQGYPSRNQHAYQHIPSLQGNLPAMSHPAQLQSQMHPQMQPQQNYMNPYVMAQQPTPMWQQQTYQQQGVMYPTSNAPQQPPNVASLPTAPQYDAPQFAREVQLPPQQSRCASLATITSSFQATPALRSQGFYPNSPDRRRGHLGPSEAGATAGSSISISGANAIPRGPPKKPVQTGFALWVGNLPANATVIDLKDHFSRGATADISSLKLISKSNCAFVNYRSQASCTAALQRFHDSRFHGTRLVCRVRKSNVEQGHETPGSGNHGSTAPGSGTDSAFVDSNEEEASSDAYLVMKSLTVDDLIMSTHSGLWATQSHNEEALNKAYEKFDNVYLLFSVNKSGEYFGYGRMASRIAPHVAPSSSSQAHSPTTETKDPLSDDKTIPNDGKGTEVGEGVGELNVENTQAGSTDSTVAWGAAAREIFTPATEWAPRGTIIDDLARGTIFWEARPCEEDDGTSKKETPKPGGGGDKQEKEVEESIANKDEDGQSLGHTMSEEGAVTGPGNAFRVEWLSTTKVPFYKVRGLKNPLNGNKDVKIARDGTRIAADVGAVLIELFLGGDLRRPVGGQP